MKNYDKVGNRYGNLIVLHKTNETRHGSYLYVCKCECGTICLIPSRDLRKNKHHTISCGCIRAMNTLCNIAYVNCDR
jgi:hypothetical protein